MTLIKIIDASILETSPDKIAGQLRAFLISIRKNKQVAGLGKNQKFRRKTTKVDLNGSDAELEDETELSYKDRGRINGRANKLAKARLAASGLSHLKREEADRLKPALGGMHIVMSKKEDLVDEVVAQLHDEMPWMGRATEYVWHSLRRSAKRNDPVTLRPVILNGPPGIGKSVWARSLATALSLPYVDVDASKGGAGMALVGVERGWGTALPGRPVELLLSQRIANPLIIVDEICKARTVTSTQGASHAFADALLSLLEPATASKWECPFFRISFDMSHISWVLTSNNIKNVPEPVRNRCHVIEIPDLNADQLHSFARRRGPKIGLSDSSLEAVVMAINQAPIVTGRCLSLRDVVRMLELAEMLEGWPRLQ